MPLHTLPDSRPLSYSLDASPKDAPIVILSNSLCAPYGFWDRVAASLNDSGFRALRYDQPGHGDSAAPKDLSANTFDSMADDVHHLLSGLGLDKVHAWVGVSMGAAAGIVFAARHPGVVGKLAVCDTISCSPVNAGIDDAFGPRVAAAREAGSMEAIVQGTLERWFGAAWLSDNPEETARLRGLMLRTSLDGFETCCAALRSPSFDLRPLFTKVGAGVDDAVCLVGEKDANLPQTMAEMRTKIQEGFGAAGKGNVEVELKVIKDAGHVCFIDGEKQFLDTIVPFLKR